MAKKRYTGHLLIANPNNPKDELEKSVLLMVSHTETTAIGIQINNPHVDLDLAKVSTGLGMIYRGREPVYYGGNLNINKIHVIHSLDWRSITTVALTKEIGLTNDISVLAAIAQGEGPRYFKACAGYCIWENGMFEVQLDARADAPSHNTSVHKWEVTPATLQNTFKIADQNLWIRSLEDCARYKINSWF